MYHRVVPILPAHDPFHMCTSIATFESHLRWLSARGYTGLPLGALTQTRSIPRRSVVITFDDGYRDTYLHAWPILRRFNFPASIFLVGDAIGDESEFDAWAGYGSVPMLSVDEIRIMHRARVDFGSHSCSHPASLVDLSDAQLGDELRRSRAIIEGILDAPIAHFAYPNSKLDSRVEEAVGDAGYTLACAGVGTRFSRLCLHRVQPPRRGSASVELVARWRFMKWQARRFLRAGAQDRAREPVAV